MTDSLQAVAAHAKEILGPALVDARTDRGELTLEVRREDIVTVCRALRDDPALAFEQLIDLCGVDYLDYGRESASGARPGPRFAVVYHLLSLGHNRRLRLRARLADEAPLIASVTEIWSAANWYEREAFDLFGIMFDGHPDLRRILTDYGFSGHPFRKDFPLIGNVEVRYDAEKQRVVYEPVTIEQRVLTPRVVREDGFARG
ncbi:MAG: NADH-quinone oxidoreductase subunit C [Candidatus Muproteobacteria bacterium RIFCSPHIGHO2_01_FULL_65_16]|uniref:NADH-quinone oxidoreductase subunit C n=1 Tax=Candidatus Muproteobacteria bacterium RIFCSPHIGHO2_01_FULL_65_16 TaxID=1817764 RepID=A0A1F6TR08_9PROT|nr:MAG: NADH-quinone oxidoreductase subunit C [Candidatus Muproteobacteria bacterium RIFCSPHIGHO2_01_FULL_65_16]